MIWNVLIESPCRTSSEWRLTREWLTGGEELNHFTENTQGIMFSSVPRTPKQHLMHEDIKENKSSLTIKLAVQYLNRDWSEFCTAWPWGNHTLLSTYNRS